MLFYTLVGIACISSFMAALAVFSALIIAGRNEQNNYQDSSATDVFPTLQFHTNAFDEAALKRLADSV